MANRTGSATRQSAETHVQVTVHLDGGVQHVFTGLPFFDHLLVGFGRHGRFGLAIDAKGDLQVDAHHTIEDVGMVLGRAISQALGDRRGIERIGASTVPMEDALVRAAFDLSGKSYLCWRLEVPGVYSPAIDLTVLEAFWKAFCDGVGANLHIDSLQGRDYHHVVEAAFEACGRALREAVHPDGTKVLPPNQEFIDGQ